MTEQREDAAKREGLLFSVTSVEEKIWCKIGALTYDSSSGDQSALCAEVDHCKSLTGHKLKSGHNCCFCDPSWAERHTTTKGMPGVFAGRTGARAAFFFGRAVGSRCSSPPPRAISSVSPPSPHATIHPALQSQQIPLRFARITNDPALRTTGPLPQRENKVTPVSPATHHP